ncbi:S-adenosylmethionine:tRNA ribosyltransferase-isomerase [Hymenobacter busanensis]|uniref:S-adenosylmethionine:tRNA ribosyltransferase-isomerase n=1 Tax=Hymenobacter busanensis TaxID=2607656 RepID=A0A7L5A0I9_9BACT|nr:S-adenosylmethionine:tRNA ribosyltransferase-isomerase [Hymenobacter busanensis]KAA9338277.1 S-adenosylmethionine:tRNA ribosyltransferase-isomerase [Hymenobacter busanensis]QHJ09299.1 S-adenosylmethionine:tRNA ribosyltransferase-isomerase [Hymenobacter busanensis]
MQPANPRLLAIRDFTYDLPAERIAPEPLPDRDASRLLVCRAGELTDRTFRDLPAELPADALLVFNNTKVVRARLHLNKPTGGQIELFCLEPVAPHRALEQAMQQTESCTWRCLVGNGKRWKTGAISTDFVTPTGQPAQLFAERAAIEDGSALIRFSWLPAELPFAQVLSAVGKLPLPPYLNRQPTNADDVRYQTVYAQHEGAVAAPTAGLHFTDAIMTALHQRGIGTAQLTLHVGAGTFQPVKAEQMQGHAMHAEPISVDAGLLRQLLAHAPRPVIAVGTTSLRTLESLYWLGRELHLSGALPAAVEQWQPYQEDAAEVSTADALQALLTHLTTTGSHAIQASTQLLIAPGYRFRVVQGLITNFHQPESTLLLLVAALLGPDWRTVYDHALANGYRFLSYGDSSLLLP